MTTKTTDIGAGAAAAAAAIILLLILLVLVIRGWLLQRHRAMPDRPRVLSGPLGRLPRDRTARAAALAALLAPSPGDGNV
jgi:hypothetical protein